MKRIRIALVTNFFPNSEQPYRGAATYQLVRRLAAFADVSVLCPLPHYPKWLKPRSFDHRRVDLDYRVPDVDVKYIEFPAVPVVTRALNGKTCASRLLGHVRSLAPDVILNYWLYPQGYAAVEIGAKLGIPSIVGSIGTDLNAIPDLVTRYFTRLTLQRATFVVTKSNSLRREAIRLGADKRNTFTIVNGCDATIFRISDRLRARTDLNISAQQQLIVYVGRLARTKGLLELVEAFSAIRREKGGVELALIGDGPDAALIKKCADKFRVAEHVQFISPQSPLGVSQWLVAATFLALPSYFEGCPNVVREATCCGRPVVATRVGGIPEIVDDRCSILVPPRDVAALTGALRIALERDWNENMIASYFRRSWEDMARELYDVCLSSLNAPSARMQTQSMREME